MEIFNIGSHKVMQIEDQAYIVRNVRTLKLYAMWAAPCIRGIMNTQITLATVVDDGKDLLIYVAEILNVYAYTRDLDESQYLLHQTLRSVVEECVYDPVGVALSIGAELHGRSPTTRKAFAKGIH